MNKQTFTKVAYAGLCIYILGLSLFLAGCVSTPSTTDTSEQTPAISLTWEKGKTYSLLPESSAYLISLVKTDLALYSSAKDMTEICPKYHALSEAGKLKAIGEFYVGLALYESSWNVRSASVDVGSASKKDTWSAGLFQVSVVDQSWAGGGTKYSYDELLTSKPNIHLATILMRRQLTNTKTIFLDNSSKFRYFATMLRGNRYSKIPQIISRVQTYAPLCK